MNPFLAIPKVIATGSSRSGFLRATVMFSPIDTTDGAQLAAWPASVFDWLRHREWKLTLRFARTRTQDGPVDDCVTAVAYAARAAWGERSLDPWLEELWREAFKIVLHEPTDRARLEAAKACAPDPCRSQTPTPAPPDAVWCALSQAVAASNLGVALKAGRGLKESPAPAAPAPKWSASTPNGTPAAPATPANKSRVEIDSVIPMRQSDLAMLLEFQRALELTSTARLAGGDVAGFIERETECAMRARRQGGADSAALSPAPEPSSIKDLRMQGRGQYQAAQLALTAADGHPCTPPAVPPTIQAVTPGSAVSADQKQIASYIGDPLDSQQVGSQVQVPSTPSDCTSEADIPGIASQRFFAIQGSPALSRLFGLTVDVEFAQADFAGILERWDPKAAAGEDAIFGYVAVDLDPASLPGHSHRERATSHAAVPPSSAASAPGPMCGPAPASNGTAYREILTLFKYRPGGHFWPATLVEAQSSGCNVPLSQRDGLLVMGEMLKVADPTDNTKVTAVPRFTITSLNVKTAAEGAIDRRCHVNPKLVLPKDIDKETCPTTPAQWARKTHQTAGLVLLDRGRQKQAVGQLAARDRAHSSTDARIFLDADDLTIGYRLDVAVPTKDAKTGQAWRTLMARRIQHGVSGLHRDKVARTLPILLAPPKDPASRANRPADEAVEWRQTIEDAVLGMPIRVLPSTGSASDGDHYLADTYVEEAIATWNGEPMGAHCAGSRAGKVASFDLGVGDTIRLPDARAEGDRRLPPLRFGWPYRLGLRAVYAGAISVPLSMARRSYDQPFKTVDEAVTLPVHPAGEPQSLRRFLRHERVDAPYLLLPDDVAMTRHGAMGYERGAHAVVRSAFASEDAERGRPASTRRVFVVPNTDVHFAAYHGVFDDVRTSKPPQGLAGVSFDAPDGGFPFVTSRVIRGINGEPFETDREITKDRSKHGDLVFQPGSESPDKRPTPYYPDPFATFYAIGVRHAGTKIYLDGDPCLIPIYSARRGYPHARPLVLRIERSDSRPRSVLRPCLEDVLRFPVATPTGTSDKSPEAVMMLAPGDDFEVDVWCIPDWQGLANRSAVVEAIGVMAAANLKGLATIEAKREALGKLLPKSVCDAFERHAANCDRGFDIVSDTPWRDGIGGLPGPSVDLQRVVALAIHETLARRPLEEIAAVRTLRATHATDRPRLSPMFFALGSLRCERAGSRPLRVLRLAPPPVTASAASQSAASEMASASAVPAPPTIASAASAPASSASTATASAKAATSTSRVAAASENCAPSHHGAASAAASGSASAPTSAPGAVRTSGAASAAAATPASGAASPPVDSPSSNASTPESNQARAAPIEYTLTGDLLVDIATTWGIEIRARTTFPTSTAFDDPFRGRSTRHLREGIWPMVSGRLLETRDVFGFSVDVDGSVSLPTSEVILLRVDELMTPIGCDQKAAADGTVALSLDDLALPDAPVALGMIKARHVFPDRKARLLELSVLARPRHETFMRTANAPAHDGRWLRPGRDLAPPSRAQDALDVAVWLPAGVRPSEPVCRSPIPAFVWSQSRQASRPGSSRHRVARRSVVRIPMSRGWFSSGAGERLGIVVWPPTLFRHSSARLADDQVLASTKDGGSLMKLPDFEDDDLGPGGRFVTRWGDDPIRPRNSGSDPSVANTFIPPSAFSDLDPSTRLGFEAEVVEMVDMPVHVGNRPRAPSDGSSAVVPGRVADDGGTAQAWLTVSLVTYEPRFDVESEQWYVDVTIEHPDEAEPFLRLGLVRYQPHAAPELQLSYPMTQWTQLLPPREVEVTLQSHARTRRVSATIKGLQPAAAQAAPGGSNANEEVPAEQRMDIAIMRDYFNEIGLRCQEVKCRDKLTSSGPSQSGSDPSCVTWEFDSGEFEVDPVLDELQRATYCVYVEERELRLPATYPEEPVSPDAARGAAGVAKLASGPRFSARVDL